MDNYHLWLTIGEAFLDAAPEPHAWVSMTKGEADVLVRANNGMARRVNVALGTYKFLCAIHEDDQADILRITGDLAARVYCKKICEGVDPASFPIAFFCFRVTGLKKDHILLDPHTMLTLPNGPRAELDLTGNPSYTEIYEIGNPRASGKDAFNRFWDFSETAIYLRTLIGSVAVAAQQFREETVAGAQESPEQKAPQHAGV